MADPRTPSATVNAADIASSQDVDWCAPHRLEQLERLCEDAGGPWSLVPSSRTVTGTIVLHDCNGAAIADLYTEGAPCPCDRLIAVAPAAISQLVAEVRRLQERRHG